MNGSKTLSDVFDRSARHLRDRAAVRDGEQEWSYAELLERSQGVSICLDRVCQQVGQRIGLMLPNSAAFVAAFYGIVRVGGVVAPMSVRYGTQELLYYLSDSGATALIVDSDSLERIQRIVAGMARPPALLEIGRGGECGIVRDGRMEAAAMSDTGSAPMLQHYTSGSTGAPKRVVRTHSNLLFELDRLQRTFDLNEQDRFLGVAPFSHVNGLVRTMMTSMFVGGTLYPLANFRRRAALDLISRERITYFGGVPHMFVVLAQTPIRGAVDLSSLRITFSSSAPLLPEDNRAFHKKYGIYVRQLYGSSETGTINVNMDRDLEGSLASVGTPLDGITVTVVDDERNPLPKGQEGEVAVASPAAITAYDGNTKANRDSFWKGFYLTGDLGRLDAHGSLTLTGRKRFLINRGGFKVNPAEVEAAIMSHPHVREVVVLGTPGPHGDDIVRCVIVPDGPCAEEEVVRHCEGRIADYKIPSRIEFRDELPKSDAGKILRNKL